MKIFFSDIALNLFLISEENDHEWKLFLDIRFKNGYFLYHINYSVYVLKLTVSFIFNEGLIIYENIFFSDIAWNVLIVSDHKVFYFWTLNSKTISFYET